MFRLCFCELKLTHSFRPVGLTCKSYNTKLSLGYYEASIRDVAKNLEPDCYFELFILLVLLKFIQLFGYPALSV